MKHDFHRTWVLEGNSEVMWSIFLLNTEIPGREAANSLLNTLKNQGTNSTHSHMMNTDFYLFICFSFYFKKSKLGQTRMDWWWCYCSCSLFFPQFRNCLGSISVLIHSVSWKQSSSSSSLMWCISLCLNIPGTSFYHQLFRSSS